MSTAKVKNNPHAGLPGARHRWRFHLSALLLFIPVASGSTFFHEEALFFGYAGLGEGKPAKMAIGPWQVEIAEYRVDVPATAGSSKTFAIRWDPGIADRIKASYLKIAQPHTPRTAGALLSGGHFRQTADVLIPDEIKPEDLLWMTVEAWDGSVHHANIPIYEVSSTTSAWLRRQPPKIVTQP